MRRENWKVNFSIFSQLELEAHVMALNKLIFPVIFAISALGLISAESVSNKVS